MATKDEKNPLTFDEIIAPLKEELTSAGTVTTVHMDSGLVHRFVGVTARSVTKRLLQYGIIELHDADGKTCFLFASHVVSCVDTPPAKEPVK